MGCHLLPRDPPNTGIKPASLTSRALADRFFTTAPPKVKHTINGYYYCHDKFLEKYEFRCNLIHTWLPSAASFSWVHWILNLEAAWKRRHSLAGDSRKPLLRKLGIEATKWVTLQARVRACTQTHTHPLSILPAQSPKVRWINRKFPGIVTASLGSWQESSHWHSFVMDKYLRVLT